MERILPVYAAPWAEPLPVTTIIPSKEDAVAMLEQYLADPGFFHSTWFTDGSLLNGSAGGAAVRIEDGAVHERILIPLGDGQVAEGEVEGVLRATEHAVKGEECHEVLAVSDSRAGLQGIISTAPRSGQFRAIEYDVLVRSAMSRHPALSITNLWTPAHIGTMGNELADEAAKAATLLPPAPNKPVSLTTCKRRINLEILERWRAQWKVAKTGRGLRGIDTSPPSLKMGGNRKSPRTKSARPSLITVNLEDLRKILSERPSPSATVGEEAPVPSPPRFILTRAATRLAEPPATPVLPPDASLVTPPKSPSSPPSPARNDTPYRPPPQLRVYAEKKLATAANAFSALADASDTVLASDLQTPDVTKAPRADQAGSGALGKRGGTINGPSARGLSPPLADRHVTQPAPATYDAAAQSPTQKRAPDPPAVPSAGKEKQAAFVALKDGALAATSFDELAKSFRELVAMIRDYRKSAPTAACLDALNAIQSRLDAHHEFPREAESAASFSALLTKSLTAPLQIMTAQLQTQHQAIQSLSKSVDSAKTAHVLSKSYASSVSSPPAPQPLAKPRPAPITSTPEERILVRCNGDTSPLFSLPYHELVPKINTELNRLGLPTITCASRSKNGDLFLVPESKAATLTLEEAWLSWGPVLFPGSRIVPPAVYSHIQLDGIPFVAAPELAELAKELTERYPELGPVVGEPIWVNKPPSATQASAILAAGGKPRTAGSVFIRLQSREKVDFEVSLCRLRLAGSAPTVVRGFPHLRVTQCWGCLKFGHIKAKCSSKEGKCGGCGETAHGAVCPSKPKCLNCGGDHRADAFSCPTRKRITEALRLRAIELTEYLNTTSSFPCSNSAPRLPESK
ncbi:hypothetical protein C8R44DRAFT_892507 [Mycena epipterygia]|nr:hypothetical protein C8R44DRAFT_892507 [Mycena epipterygia]